MIIGSYTNTDGGVHAAAVARVVKMTVDLVAATNTIGVEVYHDLAHAVPPAPPAAKGPGGFGPRPGPRRQTIATPQFVLKGADFTTDATKIDAWILTQPAYKGWKVITDTP